MGRIVVEGKGSVWRVSLDNNWRVAEKKLAEGYSAEPDAARQVLGQFSSGYESSETQPPNHSLNN